MLHETEEHFQLALQAGRMGTWDWNVCTGAVAWSANLEAIHGLPRSGFKGTVEAVIEEVHPDDRPAVTQAINRSLEEGAEYHVEYRIRWPDGSIHWLEGRGRLFRDLHGQPARMMGVCLDVTERKKADLALLESEQRYRRLLGSVTDYIFSVKLDRGRAVETTHGPGCEPVTGYPPESFVADAYLWYRMIAEEDRSAVVAQISRVVAGEEVPPFEHRIVHRDGSIRWISHTPALHRDEQGRVRAYDGLIRDVTPRKRAEEALWLSHEQYKALVNTIDGIVWECDVQTGLPTFISDQAKRLLGYSPEQWLAEPDFWVRRIHPEDRDQTLAFFNQFSAERPAREVEYRMFAADGRTVWFHDLVRVVLEKGQMVKLRGVMVDVTRRKLAEEASQKSHGLSQAIIEGTTDAVFVKDSQGRYLTINTAGARLLGKTIEEVVGKDDTELFSAETARAIMEGDRRVMAAGQFQTYEDVGTAAGVTRTYLSTKGPYRDARGNVIGLIGISRDITERKLAERFLIAEHAVTRVLSESADLHEATPRILQAICEALDWDVAALWEVDRPAGVLRCAHLWHIANVEARGFEKLSREVTYAPGHGLPGRVWASGEPAWIAGKVDDPTFFRYRIAGEEGLRAALAFPVRGGRECLGVLEFFSREMREPDEKLLAMMASISSQISQFIEHRKAEKALHQREHELGLAQQIQQGLLPRTAPAPPGFEMGGASQPAQETGGDYFDFLPMADGRLGITIGDASGKGVAAALLMVQTRAYLHALASNHAEVGRILTLTNQHLVEDIERDWFVTLFLATLDPIARTLVYCSAGHCDACILDRAGTRKTLPRGPGLPLGINAEADYVAAPPVQLEPGDIIFLFTDGIVGALSPTNFPFTIEDALKVIREHRDEPVSVIIAALLQAVRTHCGGVPFDDMTAVILKVTDSPAAG